MLLASMRGLELIWEAKAQRPFPVKPGQGKTDWKDVLMILLEAGAADPVPDRANRRQESFCG